MINQNAIDVDGVDRDGDDVSGNASFSNGVSDRNGVSAKSSSDSFEVNQLKEINLQLYQHAVKRLLQNGSA